MTNQQKLRELVNKCEDCLGAGLCQCECHFIDVMGCKCRDYCTRECIQCDGFGFDVDEPIHLEQLLVALRGKFNNLGIGFEQDEREWFIYYQEYIQQAWLPYDIEKPPLEQSEETLTELIRLLS